MGGVKIAMTNYQQQIKAIQSVQGRAEKVINRVMSDVRPRAPGGVASEVVTVDGIKKSEITPAKTGSGKKSAGSIRVKGDTVQTLQIVYKGRLLTPTHFRMTPKEPRDSYTLKAMILKREDKTVLGKKKKLTKKQRANIGRNFQRQGTQNSPNSPIMLMRTGSTYIPFQRKKQARNSVEAIKTISMPQMVSSERTREGIDQAISEGINKRMAQHLKLLEK